MLGTLIKVFIIVAIVAIIFVMGYVKAPPDRAYIISGLRKTPRILIGRAGLKIPFFERVDKLYLGQMTVDIKTEQSVPTNDFINVNVDAVAKVRIGTDTEAIQLAAKNFLNKDSDSITEDLQDSLQGNMREIIGTLDLKTINTDRDSFSDQVMEKASKDMKKLGIEILSCNIQNVTDENHLIEDLGADNTEKIKKDASIAKAQAKRDVAIAQAQADKDSNDARVQADLDIAQKQKELAIKKAELQQETDRARAIADAAYNIEQLEQQKTIETNTVNAQIAKAERDAVLKQKEVDIAEQELTATVKKQAEAEKFKRIQDAEAKLEQERREAEAKRYAMEQEALGIKAKGDAEAAAIRAKGIADAEAMEKKAEAMKKYGQAAMAEMMIKVMPQMAAEIAKPLGQIDKINIYGTSDSANGASQISGNMPIVMKQVFDTMSEATGVNFSEIMRAGTYDAKVNKNVNVTGIPESVNLVTKTEEVAEEAKDSKK